MTVFNSRLIVKYILFELIPVTVFAVSVFVFLLFMFQSFKLSEYIIVHGASVSTVGQIFFYLSLSFLPVILPTSLLFGILLVYGRLSNDSEVVAMKAIGIHPVQFSIPALVLGIGVFLLSLQISMQLAPWGNRQLDDLVHKVSQNRPTVSVREGVFSEGFFDLVVYANEVAPHDGTLRKIFIYDEREPDNPLTIIARGGKVLTRESEIGQTALLRLEDGNMHRSGNGLYTKIDFDTYDINLFAPQDHSERSLDSSSLTVPQLYRRLEEKTLTAAERNDLILEISRRWTLPAVCLVFAIIGVALGTVTNRRSGKTGGLVLCITVVILYWMFYAVTETVAKQTILPMQVMVWLPNLLFLIFGVIQWRKILQT